MVETARMDTAIPKSAQENLPAPSDLPNLRAAYSDRTSALMAFLAAFAYHPSIDAAVANRPRAVAAHASIGSREVASIPSDLGQLGFTSLSVFANGLTDGFAFVAESPELAVLSFRGTQSKANWHTNFQAALVHPEDTDANLRVHEGFYDAFEGLAKDGLKEKISAILQPLDRKPVYITGHSLGGALAQIATAVFSSDKIAACYTFGSPRVGNSYFDLWVKPPSYRVINHADLVPQVPLPLIYRHSGDPRYLPARVGISPYRYEPGVLDRISQLGEGVISLIRFGSILGIKEHAIGQYYAKLEKVATARTQGRKLDIR
jgi:triacylglycerol lipase